MSKKKLNKKEMSKNEQAKRGKRGRQQADWAKESKQMIQNRNKCVSRKWLSLKDLAREATAESARLFFLLFPLSVYVYCLFF